MSFKGRMEYPSPPISLDVILAKIAELVEKGFKESEAEDFASLLFLPDEANLCPAEQKRLAEYKERLAKYEKNK